MVTDRTESCIVKDATVTPAWRLVVQGDASSSVTRALNLEIH